MVQRYVIRWVIRCVPVLMLKEIPVYKTGFMYQANAGAILLHDRALRDDTFAHDSHNDVN